MWSVADHRVLPAITEGLAEADVACVIYVRSGDRLLARGGEIWNVRWEEMLRLRATLDRLAETASWSVLTLSLPDELLADPLLADEGTPEGGTPKASRLRAASTGTGSPTWPCSPPSTPGGTCTPTASCPAPPPRAGGCGPCSTARATRGGRWSPTLAACRPAAGRRAKTGCLSGGNDGPRG